MKVCHIRVKNPLYVIILSSILQDGLVIGEFGRVTQSKNTTKHLYSYITTQNINMPQILILKFQVALRLFF